MLQKSYTKTGRSCRVTFSHHPDAPAESAHLVGEFNQWDRKASPMKPKKGGGFSLQISLKPGRSYRFRYLLDGSRWENEHSADGYAVNEFGSDDSVISV